jgi:hypothetical protein
MATLTETQVLPSTWDSQNEVLINNPAPMSPTTFSRNVSTEFSYYKEPEDGGHARPVNVKKDKKLNKRN